MDDDKDNVFIKNKKQIFDKIRKEKILERRREHRIKLRNKRNKK